MLTRKTARVLLFDPAGRLLLMRMHDLDVADANGKVLADAYWITIGGKMEPGEDVAAAALREVAEETGLEDTRLGSPVWYAEHVLSVRGTLLLFQETFVVAFTSGKGLDDRRWTADERRSIKGMKWWTAKELNASPDTFFPTSLKRHLPPICKGEYPERVICIEP